MYYVIFYDCEDSNQNRLTEGAWRREVESSDSEGRGKQSAYEEQPQSGGQPEVLDQSVREKTSSKNAKRPSEDWGTEGPSADVKVWVVKLEEVPCVVGPAVAGRVSEKCWMYNEYLVDLMLIVRELPARSKIIMEGEQKDLRSFFK